MCEFALGRGAGSPEHGSIIGRGARRAECRDRGAAHGRILSNSARSAALARCALHAINSGPVPGAAQQRWRVDEDENEDQGVPSVEIACLDLEGVLIPEVWIGVAERTGIEALRATTRDVPDYDELMQQRLRILRENDVGIHDIQEVIAGMRPLDGAKECLDWLRERFQVVILSDTFYEFAEPLMRQLDWPTLFCHKLETNDAGVIENYRLRQADPKRKAVQAFHSLNFRIIAAGDSYNDTSMLSEADAGILFCPPQNVIDEFPQFPVATSYSELQAEFSRASVRDIRA